MCVCVYVVQAVSHQYSVLHQYACVRVCVCVTAHLKVVEHVLFVLLATCITPLYPVLPSASHVGLSKHTLEPTHEREPETHTHTHTQRDTHTHSYGLS